MVVDCNKNLNVSVKEIKIRLKKNSKIYDVIKMFLLLYFMKMKIVIIIIIIDNSNYLLVQFCSSNNLKFLLLDSHKIMFFPNFEEMLFYVLVST